MPTESVTETTALEFPTLPVESSDGLKRQHLEDILSGKDPQYDSSKASAVSQSCLEVNVALMLMVFAGFLILVLLYCVLLLRHKLRLAQSGNALEYFSFYHMANYNLKHLHESSGLPSVNIHPLVEVPSFTTPPAVVPIHAVCPPRLPPPLPLSSRPPSIVPLSPPIIYTTPPSPKSDAEVYSRIGTVLPYRHSSVSQSQVVLFEHSSL